MVAEGRGSVKLQVLNQQVVLHARGLDDLPAILMIPTHPRLKVTMDDVPVQGRVEVHANRKIHTELIAVLPERRASIIVSSDGMEATLLIEYVEGTSATLRDVDVSTVVNMYVTETPVRASLFEVQDIEGVLQENNIVFGIDRQAIENLLSTQKSGQCVCATGRQPVESIPERYDILVEDSAERQMVGIMPVRPILMVRANEIVAMRMAPVQGADGMTVHGQLVVPKSVKPRLPKVGRGAQESPEGLVHATRGGRIIESPRLLDVAETYVIENSLRAIDGRIEFEGDVHVRGNVEDGVEIISGGQVRVTGFVSNATIVADGGVIISGGAFQSSVYAGTRLQSFGKIRAGLETAMQRLQRLAQAVLQVQQALGAQGKQLPVGRLAVQLLQTKFPEILQTKAQISDLISVHKASLSGQWIAYLQQVADEFTQVRIEGVTEPTHWFSLCEAMSERLAETVDERDLDVDIQVRNGQATRFESTGNIFSTGQGFYQCQLTAGKEIRALGTPGVILGCMVSAGELVHAREIGSQSEVGTTVAIHSKQGSAKAQIIHPGTVLTVGQWTHKVLKEMRNATWP